MNDEDILNDCRNKIWYVLLSTKNDTEARAMLQSLGVLSAYLHVLSGAEDFYDHAKQTFSTALARLYFDKQMEEFQENNLPKAKEFLKWLKQESNHTDYGSHNCEKMNEKREILEKMIKLTENMKDLTK